MFDDSTSWDWQEAGDVPLDDFSIEYAPLAVLPTWDQGDSVSAATPTEPSSHVADMPLAPRPVASTFVAPTSGITPTSADRDTPAHRYRKLENIKVELDEELHLIVGEEPTSFT